MAPRCDLLGANPDISVRAIVDTVDTVDRADVGETPTCATAGGVDERRAFPCARLHERLCAGVAALYAPP